MKTISIENENGYKHKDNFTVKTKQETEIDTDLIDSIHEKNSKFVVTYKRVKNEK